MPEDRRPARRAARATLLGVVALLPAAHADDAPPPKGGPPHPADPAAPAPEAPRPLRLIGPRSGPERKKALQRFGGNDLTEASVAAGLDWLARHQDEDGGWDADGFPARCADGGPACAGVGKGQHGEDVPCPFDAAISGFATLAFLGAGHRPGAEGDVYGPVVARALARLESANDVWGLPVATEAFAEAAAADPKGPWLAAARRGVEALAARRQDDGGWGYAAPWRPGSDVPYAALVVAALATARDVGIDVPQDAGPRIDAWLSTLEESKGRLAYLLDGRKYGYTPTTSNAHCAVAMRELLGAGLDGARHRAHRALVAAERPVWKISFREVDVPGRGKVPVQVGNLSMLQWWYGTVGLFQSGGDAWGGWFGAVKGALVGHQQKAGCARGSWDPLGTYERQTGGRVLATALGVLMLEQPYRHRRLRE